jgi:hypothetical protein
MRLHASPALQAVLDLAAITLNKNSVAGDASAVVPGGVRIGTPALTTRGFREPDFEQVADLVDRYVVLAECANARHCIAQCRICCHRVHRRDGAQHVQLPQRPDFERVASLMHWHATFVFALAWHCV